MSHNNDSFDGDNFTSARAANATATIDMSTPAPATIIETPGFTEQQPLTDGGEDQHDEPQEAEEAPPAATPDPIDVSNVNVDMARSIALNMVAVYVTVKRPTARPKAKNVRVEVKADGSDARVNVEAGDATTPCWKADKYHKIWKEVDATKTKIDNILNFYSASDSQKGEHLVSMVSVGQMIAALDRVREERLAIVRRMQEIWDTEILPGIRQAKPEYAEQMIEGLPSKHRLLAAFNVVWNLRPLTPVEGASIDVSTLNEEDARRVVDRTNGMIDASFQQRFQNIFDDVFGQLAEVCREVETDGLGGGRRNQQSIDRIVTILDRVNNFRQFASPAVLETIQSARAILKSTNPQDINSTQAVRDSIQNAFKPLAAAVEELTTQAVGGNRAGRTINL